MEKSTFEELYNKLTQQQKITLAGTEKLKGNHLLKQSVLVCAYLIQHPSLIATYMDRVVAPDKALDELLESMNPHKFLNKYQLQLNKFRTTPEREFLQLEGAISMRGAHRTEFGERDKHYYWSFINPVSVHLAKNRQYSLEIARMLCSRYPNLVLSDAGLQQPFGFETNTVAYTLGKLEKQSRKKMIEVPFLRELYEIDDLIGASHEFLEIITSPKAIEKIRHYEAKRLDMLEDEFSHCINNTRIMKERVDSLLEETQVLDHMWAHVFEHTEHHLS